MKVTVCFGNVRVIVPCGDGELLVSELINKSVTRYKKAAGKPTDHWISVHNLRTCNDGGILDPDDQVNDVADDREQIIAVYEEQGGPPLNHNGGDGASASSVGTGSPESFNSRDQGPDYTSALHFQQNEDHDVVVTPNDLAENTGLTVHVRRGSEPALNTLPDDTPNYSSSTLPKHTKKRSTASPKLTIVKDVEYNSAGSSPEGSLKSGIRRTGLKNDLSRFSRDSWRQSLGNRPGMYKWLEAQERQEDKYKTQDDERNEPIGESSTESYGSGRDENSNTISAGILICMKNEGGPLGIHVVPNVDDNGRTLGLLIQEIEPERRIFKDGRFCVNDNIIEINGNSIVDTTYKESQEIFRQAMLSDEIRLRVIREVETLPSPPKVPPPVLPKPMKNRQMPLKPSPLTLPTGDQNNADNKENINGDQSDDHWTVTNSAKNDRLNVSDSETTKPVPALRTSPNNKNNQPIKTGQPISPSPPSPKKVPPAVPARHPSTTLSKPPAERNLSAPTNTRKIGRKISINLQKGVSGLGFSITTRDNFAGGNCPIYIKSILPKGAAITQGELKSGDRLLEVNDIHMTGKSQADAVTILRNIPMGSIVNLVVSRQEAVADEKFEVPRKLTDSGDAVTPTNNTVLQPSEQSGDLDGTLVEMKHKEFYSFDIPLNDSGSAGLGVSVKGTTLTTDGEESDLGIFIKAVIHGGAASKDGHLLVNDQLLNVNGLSLVDLPNTHAMDMLRRAMVIDGPVPGCINIQVARKADASTTVPYAEHPIGSQSIARSDSSTQGSTRGDTTDGDQMPSNSEASENSDQTVIMLAKNINNGPNRGVDTKNLILDRYINGENLRNNAYHKTNMNLNLIDSSHSTDDNLPPPCHTATSNGRLSSLTVNPAPVDSVMIENDNYIQHPDPRARPHSTIGILRSSPVSHNSSSTEDLRSSSPPPWLKNWDQYGLTEPLSPDEDLFTFQREGFGRQSMSEKRRGHLDPRGSEFYQMAKSNRSSDRSSTSAGPRPLTRSGSTDSLLMAKKPPSVHDPHVVHSKQAPLVPLAILSNSIESLHSSTPDPSGEEEHGSITDSGVQRNRGCNESFRAAVDRSYDPTPIEAITMDTLEEESSEGDSMRIGRSTTNSARSSQSSVSIGEDIYGRKIRRKDKEKKGGIFKGLFRFGKNRKSLDDLHNRMDPAAFHQSDADGSDQWEKPRVRALQDQESRKYAKPESNMGYGSNLESQHHAGQGDGDRSQHLAGQGDDDRREPWEIAQALKDEQYRLQDQQRKVQEHQMVDHPAERNYTKFPQKYPDDLSDDGVPLIPQHAPINSRAERVNRLRAEHQRKHQERHGQYPLEEQEERHEQWLREQEIKKYGRPMVPDSEVLLSRQRPLHQPHYDRYSPHPLSTRPSSRLGHSDPINYSHYQNAEEIRQQILQHDHYAEEFRRMQAHHQKQVSDSSIGNHSSSNAYYQQNNVDERSRHLSNASSEARNRPVNSANISQPMTRHDNSTSSQLSGANIEHFSKPSYTARPVSRNHNEAMTNSYHYPDTAPFGYRNQNYIPPPGSAQV